MKTFRFIGMALLAVVVSINFIACSDDEEKSGEYKLAGTSWTQDGDDDIFCFLNGGEVVTYENYIDYKNGEKAYHMKWSINGDVLTLTDDGYFENGIIIPSDKQYIEYWQITSFNDSKMVLKLLNSDNGYDEIGKTWTFDRLK